MSSARANLRARLVAAAREFQRSGLRSHPEELGGQVQLAADLASEFEGKEDEFFPFLSPGLSAGDLIFEEWMWNLANRLAGFGLVDEAVAVSEIFARLDPGDAWNHRCNAATALAEGDRIEEARQQVEENIADFPDRHPVMIGSAHALAACGDLDGAKTLYWRALDLVQEAGDPQDVESVRDWFEQFFDDHAPDDPDRRVLDERVTLRRRRARQTIAKGEPKVPTEPAVSLVKPPPVKAGARVGRNESCPCGSGQKFKRCCGRV
jgi:tetratricopeptide (TPR) repeat protein